MTSGIYKITNPKGKVYIGKSSKIEVRWNNYRKYRCKTQKKLYNSLTSYGVEEHSFELVEECRDLYLLHQLEDKYISQYNSIEDGLNMRRVGKEHNFYKVTKQGQLTRSKNLKKLREDDPNLYYKKVVLSRTKKTVSIYNPEGILLMENVSIPTIVNEFNTTRATVERSYDKGGRLIEKGRLAGYYITPYPSNTNKQVEKIQNLTEFKSSFTKEIELLRHRLKLDIDETIDRILKSLKY